jgi:uncharacterized RDD family membrane protein YckC
LRRTVTEARNHRQEDNHEHARDSTRPTAITEYRQFGERFLAYLIDAIIVGFISNLLFGILGFGIPFDGSSPRDWEGTFNGLLMFGYLVYFWATTGQTPGKRILGLKVIGLNGETDGIGYRAAVLRYLGYMVSAIVFFLGYLWIIGDPEKQGWHDKIAGTHVVKTTACSRAGLPWPSWRARPSGSSSARW